MTYGEAVWEEMHTRLVETYGTVLKISLMVVEIVRNQTPIVGRHGWRRGGIGRVRAGW